MMIDMHCDTLYRIREERKRGNWFSLRDSSQLCVNLEKMRNAQYVLQNFAVFIDLKEREDRFENAMELIQIFEEEMAANCGCIIPVTSAAQIEQNQKSGKLSALLTLEEGGMCEGEIEKLHAFYNRGARMMTLTWNYENELGFSAADQASRGTGSSCGLKTRGFEFLEEMEALHMIPDVSHLSDDGFWDVSRTYRRPFVASHSNARTLCGHFRNLSDEMIRCMGDQGCVIGLNFYPEFLISEEKLSQKKDSMMLQRSQEIWLDQIAAHAVHMIQKGGLECVGLGTDFDGFGGGSCPADASEMDQLVWIFHKHGLSDDEIDRILYRNVLRLYRDVLL